MNVKKNKKNLPAKYLATWLLILIPFVFCSMAQPDNKSAASVHSLTRTINIFLTVWLVKKDKDRALNFFSRRAFLNKGMLSESCAGYIKDEEHASPNTIKQGVRRFLSEFSSDKNKTLNDWLTKNMRRTLKMRESPYLKLPNIGFLKPLGS